MVEVTGLEDVGFQAKSTQNWEIFKFSWHFGLAHNFSQN